MPKFRRFKLSLGSIIRQNPKDLVLCLPDRPGTTIDVVDQDAE